MNFQIDRFGRSIDGTRIFLIITCASKKAADKLEEELRKGLDIMGQT